MRNWHSGPPPSIGWWNASSFLDEKIWRWWDGEVWSSGVTKDATDNQVAFAASVPFQLTWGVQWTNYYPKNARVAR